jgi:transcriptional regulator of met regulon
LHLIANSHKTGILGVLFAEVVVHSNGSRESHHVVKDELSAGVAIIKLHADARTLEQVEVRIETTGTELLNEGVHQVAQVVIDPLKK